MSVASITSTDAPLDCLFGRTDRSIERRVSAQAMFCPCSQVVFSNTKIHVARMIEASTEISDAFLGPFFGELKSKRFMDWVFGRDSLSDKLEGYPRQPE